MVMLTILLGLLSTLVGGGVIQRHALSKFPEGNDIDRHLVRQMTVLSGGNDQWLRFIYPQPRDGCQNRRRRM